MGEKRGSNWLSTSRSELESLVSKLRREVRQLRARAEAAEQDKVELIQLNAQKDSDFVRVCDSRDWWREEAERLRSRAEAGKAELKAANEHAERLATSLANCLDESIDNMRSECQANCRIISDGPDGIKTASDGCPECDRTWECSFAERVKKYRAILAVHEARKNGRSGGG